MLENSTGDGVLPLGPTEEPSIDQSTVRRLVTTFLTVVSLPSHFDHSYPANAIDLIPLRQAV